MKIIFIIIFGKGLNRVYLRNLLLLRGILRLLFGRLDEIVRGLVFVTALMEDGGSCPEQSTTKPKFARRLKRS
jgi:hypothetical protein